MTTDGATTVEALRAELARAKEQARFGNAAALKAAEELRASFESMEGDLEQFAQTCQDRYEDFKKAVINKK